MLRGFEIFPRKSSTHSLSSFKWQIHCWVPRIDNELEFDVERGIKMKKSHKKNYELKKGS